MIKLKNIFISILLVIVLNGCSTMKLEDFKLKKPELKLEEFLKIDLEISKNLSLFILMGPGTASS